MAPSHHPTRVGRAAHARVLNVKHVRAMTNTHMLTTHIPPQTTPATISEADLGKLVSEFAQLVHTDNGNTPKLLSLIGNVLFALARIIPAHEENASFRFAALASLNARSHRRKTTLTDLRSYINRILKFADWADLNIRNIRRKDCRLLLEKHFSKSGHIYAKAKAVLHSIFAYAIRNEWCERNPVSGLDSIYIHEERIEILSNKQIRALMHTLDRAEHRNMQAAVRLMLWCGIRPGEVQRLRWRDIDFRENEVYIESHNSKTGGARAVPLRGGALCLKLFRKQEDMLIAPGNWNRLWAKLRRRAGLRHWQKDALRHTFASYHLKRFHNFQLLQAEMGHRDSTLLRTRYLNLRNLSSQAATKFFSWNKLPTYAAKED